VIEETAIVVAVEGQTIWVETQRQTACGQCAANKGCGSAVWQKVLGKKRNILPVTGDLPVNVGDKVIIGVNEDSLVKGSIAVYAVPVVSMIAFAVMGETLATNTLSINSDLLSVTGAFVGLLVSIGVLRWYSRRASNNARYQPELLRHVQQAGIDPMRSDTSILT
jgi:sigma-E factor negative regulatory protein RseC